MRRLTLGLGISHGLLVAPNPPCPPYRSTILPSLHLASLSSTKYRPERLFGPKGGLGPVFERDTLSFAPPPTIRARCRPRSAQCGNQRSKHVGTVDLPDSVGEDGIWSLMAEETIDGVGG